MRRETGAAAHVDLAEAPHPGETEGGAISRHFTRGEIHSFRARCCDEQDP